MLKFDRVLSDQTLIQRPLKNGVNYAISILLAHIFSCIQKCGDILAMACIILALRFMVRKYRNELEFAFFVALTISKKSDKLLEKEIDSSKLFMKRMNIELQNNLIFELPQD